MIKHSCGTKIHFLVSDAKIQQKKGANNSFRGLYNDWDNDYNEWDNE